MEEIVKTFNGHSGSKVYLKNGTSGLYVEKVGNVRRNFERMSALSKYEWITLPQIYMYDETNEILRMEYIHGLDMKTYLRHNHPKLLVDHLWKVASRLVEIQDRRSTAPSFLQNVHPILNSIHWIGEEKHPFPFTLKEIQDAIRPHFYQTTPSEYIGDLTLENIIWSETKGFVHIDPVTTPFKSIEYDFVKLRQDTVYHWFLRNEPNPDANLVHALNYIADQAPYRIYNPALDILMLLRVFRHCTPNTPDYDFIVRTVNKIWT